MIAGCAGMAGKTVEERADIAAMTSLESLDLLLDRARLLYTIDTISPDQYLSFLDGADDLKALIGALESQADIVGGINLDCLKPELDANQDGRCDRSDVTQLLIDLRDSIE